jgi:outer membrane protein OmpA-like peptidoglycan-associated protein
MNIKYPALLFALIIAVVGCAKDEYGNTRPLTDAEKGALIGAAVGAGVGLTQKKKHGTKAVVIGAVGGGIAGGLVGNYMDSQKKDLEKVLAPEMGNGSINLQKLEQHRLRISMTSATAFDVNSSQIKPGFYSTMDKIAKVLNKYGKTELLIVGHTDSTGSEKYNQTLSEQRAQSVYQYLQGQGVIHQRLSAYGKGELEPIASNDTDQGRRMNRRVEILVVPLVAE